MGVTCRLVQSPLSKFTRENNILEPVNMNDPTIQIFNSTIKQCQKHLKDEFQTVKGQDKMQLIKAIEKHFRQQMNHLSCQDELCAEEMKIQDIMSVAITSSCAVPARSVCFI